MIAEIIRRGNEGPHHLNDVREEEMQSMARVVGAENATVGDYLSMSGPLCDFMVTNPPFTLAVDFVKKAMTHISGPVAILQSVAWQGTKRRSDWLKGSNLAYVLNLARRPKWEVDSGVKPPSNIWDFAWFVFLPGHVGLPQMDWLS